MNTYEKSARTIAGILLDYQAVDISLDKPYTWASGIKSPIYCDNRLLIGIVEARKAIVNAFCDLIDEKMGNYDYLAGTATAGIPWAAFLAEKLNKPMVYVRSGAKEHGKGKQIEGKMPEGRKVVLVEDLISTGGSSMNAVSALENEGKVKVVSIVSIMNYRLRQALELFEKENRAVWSLTDIDIVLEPARKSGKVESIEQILDFQNDPDNWAKK